MIQPIRTIVADEDSSRATIVRMVNEYFPLISIVGESNNCKTAYKAIEKHRPQLVFVGIEMDGCGGFELLKMFREIPFKFIIVSTAHQHAVDAFRFRASDYLLKPVKQEELIAAVQKATNDLTREFAFRNPELFQKRRFLEEEPNHNLVISNNKGFIVIKIPNIIFCEADGYCTNFYLTDNSKISSSYNLKYYESLLSEAQFLRVHNSFIINKEHVKGYTFQGEILLCNNLKCSLSAKYKRVFFKAFGRMKK